MISHWHGYATSDTRLAGIGGTSTTRRNLDDLADAPHQRSSGWDVYNWSATRMGASVLPLLSCDDRHHIFMHGTSREGSINAAR